MDVHIPAKDSRYYAYRMLQSMALDECKNGGDPLKAQALATLTLAEATALNEPTERMEISGSLTVDT